MFERMKEDIERVKSEDPAAPSSAVVVLCYSGLHALWNHRFEHWLWNKGRHGLARWLSGFTRHFTGVEIHPGAEIGRRVFIDHGMGVVIGETAVVGDGCTLYQGCTLGGTGKETGKRHPTLDEDVIVGCGAKVLGNITVGKGSKIGGGSVVVDDVPPDCTVVGVPGHVVRRAGRRVKPADASCRHEDLPDPILSVIEQLKRRIDLLDRRIDMLQCLAGDGPVIKHDERPVALENRSLAVQLMTEENMVREAEGRIALSRELESYAREVAERAAVAEAHDAGDAGRASRIIASALGDKISQLPDDAPDDEVARRIADVLEDMARALRGEARRGTEAAATGQGPGDGAAPPIPEGTSRSEQTSAVGNSQGA